MNIYRGMFHASCFVVAIFFQQRTVMAQLIGNRTIGAPAGATQQQRPQGGLTSAVGITGATGSTTMPGANAGLQGGTNRYVRGNRSRLDFVGSNRTDLKGFVGSEQALGVGRVLSAVENLRIETTKSGKINRPLPQQPAKGMYYPKLEIDFEVPDAQVATGTGGQARPEVRERVNQVAGSNAIITMSGNTAVLRGAVNSKRTSELIEQLLRFEPGIDRVRNELTIK